MTDPRGRSFGAAAEDYERGRPGWPDRVAEAAELPADANVLDLAAGTGKLTRLLTRHFAAVVAVEPDDAMRALIPHAETLAGSAEEIPLPDASVDGVFCAEAFHWFDAPRAVAEIARVLRPGGPLVVCFNEPSRETDPPWPEQGREVLRRRREPGRRIGGRQLVEEGTWREPFAAGVGSTEPAQERGAGLAGAERGRAPFERLRCETVEHENVHDTEAEIARILSISDFALLADDDRETLREELRAALPQQTWRTPLRAEIWSTRRLAG